MWGWLRDRPDEFILRWVLRVLLVSTIAAAALDYRLLGSAVREREISPRETPSPVPLPPAQYGPVDAPELPGRESTAKLRAAMTFELASDGRLLASGTIAPGSAKAFAEEIEKRGSYVRTVVLHSPGGSVQDALLMGRLIREKGFATEVASGSYCASSCPLVFAGGSQRIAGKGAAIGVHQVYGALRDAGIDTVIRYYSYANNAGLNCKNITLRERDMLHDMGFAIGIVYQHQGRVENRYSPTLAKHDAEFCLERAKVIKQPHNSAIYIGVDSDAGLNTDADVLAYFKIVNDVFDGRYRVGINAAGSRCQLIKDAVYRKPNGTEREGLADLFWVPEEPDWSGTRAYMNSRKWTLYQGKTEVQRSALARDMGQEIKLDVNFINPFVAPSIGAFNKDGSERFYDSARIKAVAEARYWVKADRLPLLNATDGAEVSHMCISRIVHVLKTESDWASVDIDEDGTHDGFCRIGDLAPLARMPGWRDVCSPKAL